MKGYWEAEAQKAANRGRWGEAANNYFHAGNVTKMREALEKAIWSDRDGEYQAANVGILGLIGSLRENGQLDRFMKNVSQERSDPLKWVQRIYLTWLIGDLIAAQEALHAAHLLKKFHKSLLVSESGAFMQRSLWTLKEVLKGLIDQQKSEDAFILCKLIMDEDSSDLWSKKWSGKDVVDWGGKATREAEWGWIAELFLNAKDKKTAGKMYQLYFNIKPRFVYVDTEVVSALKDLGEWPSFLDEISKARPLDLGQFLSKRLSSELLGLGKKESGELEVSSIVRCYDAVGPREYVDFSGGKEQTTEWLYNVIQFYGNQGDPAKAEELRYRRWEDRRRLGRNDLDVASSLAQVSYQNADQQKFKAAAEAMEKAAKDEMFSKYPAGFWYQAAKLYDRAGNSKRARNTAYR
jgi:hypothetical protein